MFQPRSDNPDRVAREEAVNKNPIISRLVFDAEGRDPDRDRDVFGQARDFYHSFIARTLKRNYKRPPIDLVDEWVPHALGVFLRARPPSVEPWAEAVGRVDNNPLDRRLEPSRTFGNAVLMMRALRAVQSHMGRVGLLRMREHIDHLCMICRGMLEQPTLQQDLEFMLLQVSHLLRRATECLNADEELRHLVDYTFATEFGRLADDLVAATRQFASEPCVAPLGVSFDPDRGSGVLFGSIPELGIVGPAILLSPATIGRWAQSPVWAAVRDCTNPHLVGTDLETAAIANVLFHEMTHAMLALATDPIQLPAEMTRERIGAYRRDPQFEEGAADFIGNLCFLYSILHDGVIRGDLRDLHLARYSRDARDWLDALRPTYAGYSNPATDQFFEAWRGNKQDLGGFAGLFNMYACNFGEMDWQDTLATLLQGKISIGRYR